jgi:hypothetical protein
VTRHDLIIIFDGTFFQNEQSDSRIISAHLNLCSPLNRLSCLRRCRGGSGAVGRRTQGPGRRNKKNSDRTRPGGIWSRVPSPFNIPGMARWFPTHPTGSLPLSYGGRSGRPLSERDRVRLASRRRSTTGLRCPGLPAGPQRVEVRTNEAPHHRQIREWLSQHFQDETRMAWDYCTLVHLKIYLI